MRQRTRSEQRKKKATFTFLLHPSFSLSFFSRDMEKTISRKLCMYAYFQERDVILSLSLDLKIEMFKTIPGQEVAEVP